ncbi:MAG: hypothetical protein U5K74_08845 [Gemmatimonadaceae bacterium]|nr:hypothetical protein [Gemmatimonadaceae bacterium]
MPSVLLFEGNVLENNWIDGQVGFAILFQALSQDGDAPWSTIQDITVRNNIIKNSTSGINILSRVTIIRRHSGRAVAPDSVLEQPVPECRSEPG